MPAIPIPVQASSNGVFAAVLELLLMFNVAERLLADEVLSHVCCCVCVFVSLMLGAGVDVCYLQLPGVMM